jgi:hypothetical protein
MTDYKVIRITKFNFKKFDYQILNFITCAAIRLQREFESKYDWGTIDLGSFIQNHYLSFCFRNNKPVGFLAASFSKSFFDPQCKILRQNLLYSLPNTRASFLLLKEFVDFGKVNANHVITTIGPKTNIKRQSLEKLGFSKLEELYRMEIST